MLNECRIRFMVLEFSGEVWYWKGPAPFFFVTVPAIESAQIKSLEKMVTYGWGMIPAMVKVGSTEWKTALWPKDGCYVVPLKDAVRKKEGIEEGSEIRARLELDIAGF